MSFEEDKLITARNEFIAFFVRGAIWLAFFFLAMFLMHL